MTDFSADKLRALDEAAIEAAAIAFAQAFYGPNFDAHLNPEAFDMALAATRAALATSAIFAMAEDAARYRWLRDHSCPPHNFYISVPDEFSGVRYGPSEVDAYIDAARRALGEETA